MSGDLQEPVWDGSLQQGRVEDIEEVAFVFHNAEVNDRAPGEGTTCYVTRYRSDDVEIAAETFCSFPDESPDYALKERSYGYEVFKDLSSITTCDAIAPVGSVKT